MGSIHGRCQHSELFFILSKVLHTQSLNLSALRLWIAVDKDSFIKTAHCTCVAGLGECCTHIGGTLFALMSIARKFEEDNLISVTDMKTYWKVPSCKLKIQVPCEKIKWNKISQSAQKGKRQVQTASCAQVITASVFKQAARTNLKNVSMSLLKREEEQKTQLTIETSGFIIDKEKSYYACSPDGIWRCDCCGEMPVEVKCPFCLKDGNVATFIFSSSCLIIKENGEWRISKQRQYY
ncbi:uncharacterized protein LOC129944565 [Eupeodes corollae]|uniref:uncharacterized protein LOC129944565 n=1 Tax=Eupeodes corollae TaxID=290404 RepID=UPI0024920102|nr:uncharacterized protein LOC129944565 [Eupeodes corollae]